MDNKDTIIELVNKIEKEMNDIIEAQEHLDAGSKDHEANRKALEDYAVIINKLNADAFKDSEVAIKLGELEMKRKELELKNEELLKKAEAEKRAAYIDTGLKVAGSILVAGLVVYVVKHEDVDVITSKVFNPIMNAAVRLFTI